MRRASTHPFIDVSEVEAYRRQVFPEHVARSYVPGRPVGVPGDEYVARLEHADFHEWFGTKCDHRCPHRLDELPVARLRRPGFFSRVIARITRRAS